MDTDLFESQRRLMVDNHLVARGIRDVRVLEAMALVPRERFVEAALAPRAYEDGSLPIGESQTISQPCIVAKMFEAARLPRGARVLDVGTGSGYAAAVLSRLVKTVYTIERHPSLSAQASATLVSLGYDNVTCVVGDGTHGLPKAAPFDAIFSAAASRTAPPQLLEQLAIGGRLIMPVGSPREQTLMSILRLGSNRFAIERLAAVRCAALVLAHAHDYSEGDQAQARRSA